MILIIALAGAFVQATMLGAAIYMLHINLVDRSEERENGKRRKNKDKLIGRKILTSANLHLSL